MSAQTHFTLAMCNVSEVMCVVQDIRLTCLSVFDLSIGAQTLAMWPLTPSAVWGACHRSEVFWVSWTQRHTLTSPLSFSVSNFHSCCLFSLTNNVLPLLHSPLEKPFWDVCFYRVPPSCFRPILFLHVSIISTGYHPSTRLQRQSCIRFIVRKSSCSSRNVFRSSLITLLLYQMNQGNSTHTHTRTSNIFKLADRTVYKSSRLF